MRKCMETMTWFVCVRVYVFDSFFSSLTAYLTCKLRGGWAHEGLCVCVSLCMTMIVIVFVSNCVSLWEYLQWVYSSCLYKYVCVYVSYIFHCVCECALNCRVRVGWLVSLSVCLCLSQACSI